MSISLIIVLLAKYLIFISAILTIWLWLSLKKEQKLLFALQFIIGGVLVFLISKGISHFYYDPRPFVSLHQVPLFSHAPDNGFPSDHTTISMLAALISLLYSRKIGTALIIFSLLIGTARVLSLVHSSIDIIGAVFIAGTSTWVAFLISRYILKTGKIIHI